jgi:hypothetical protein
MRVLTIAQSYAYAIVYGLKGVENRAWTTPYRGTIAIHTGKTDDGKAYDKIDIFEDFKKTRREDGTGYPITDACALLCNDPDGHLALRPGCAGDIDKARALAMLRWIINATDDEIQPGAIIGLVDITGIVKDSPSRWAELGFNHWTLANPRRFAKPIIGVRGMPGFWQYPDDKLLSREVVP